jgi:tRNA pseudouridine55 synthase
MARRGKKRGRPVSGWVVFDKPVGMGSTEAVSKIKWLFQAEKAGHAGTLDPLASGMLPIALGEATKTVPYVMDGAKVYRFTVAWGEERATDDREGPATRMSEKRPTEAEIRAVMPSYTGVIQQTPPQFSAIKIAGERAYDLAREGETVDIPAREVEIDRLDLVEMRGADLTVFEVECGKGTYVRSLARDMGRDLGCYGHVAELRRTEVEPFTPEDLVTLAELEAAADLPKADDAGEAVGETRGEAKGEGKPAPRSFAALDALVVETGAALEFLPQVAVGDDAAVKIRLGNAVFIRGRDAPVEAAEACVTARGKLIAIGAIEAGMFKPRRVFTEG